MWGGCGGTAEMQGMFPCSANPCLADALLGVTYGTSKVFFFVGLLHLKCFALETLHAQVLYWHCV